MNYLRLTKYILSAAIAFSACIGYSLSSHSIITDHSILFTFFGVYLLASGASALNQYIERNKDLLMQRTAGRPIPSGHITPENALIVSLLCVFCGAFILSFISLTAMFLGLLNVVIYDFIYTPLKYKTSLTILPGGLVGAIPPLIGWFCAGETTLAPGIIYFSVFMFLWQVPHFIILNMKYREEYQNAGIFSVAGTFDISKVKNILFIWFVCAGLASLLFPLAGIITSKIQIIFLMFLNLSIIILFAYLILNKKPNSLSIGNVFIHVYLVSLFLLILSEKILQGL